MKEIIVSGISYSINADGMTASVERCEDREMVAAVIAGSVRIGAREYPVVAIRDCAFEYCKSMHSVMIPESVKSIGDMAFANSGLKSVTITKNVISIVANPFVGCENLCSIVVDERNSVYDSRENCNAIVETVSNVLIAGCKNSTIPDSVTGFGDNAFYGTHLSQIGFSDNVKSFGNGSFGFCNFSSLVIPSNVGKIAHNAFIGSRELASIVVAEGNAVYDSRENCNALIETATNILVLGCRNTTIPSSVVGIGKNAFFRSSVQSLIVPNSVGSIGMEAFYESEISSVVLPENITEIGDFAFSYTKLKSLSVPKSLTDLHCGMAGVFGPCADLESIVVDDGNPVFDSRDNCNAIIHTKTNTLLFGCINTTFPQTVTSIGMDAFSENYNLRSVVIPENIRRIGTMAFFCCYNLLSVEIQGKPDEIGCYIFAECNSLVCLKVHSTQPFAVNWETFTQKNYEDIVLLVPTGSKQAYKKARCWSNFKEIEEF